MHPLLQVENNGSILTANYVTSFKKDGSPRISTRRAAGGDLFNLDKAKKTHQKTALTLMCDLKEVDDRWCIVKSIYFDKPRCVYVLYSNGEQECMFQYESSEAPGSGQRTFLAPSINLSRINWTNCHFEFITLMLANNASPVYNNFNRKQRWQILQYVQEGLDFDMAVMAETICA